MYKSLFDVAIFSSKYLHIYTLIYLLYRCAEIISTSNSTCLNVFVDDDDKLIISVSWKFNDKMEGETTDITIINDFFPISFLIDPVAL